MYSKFEFNDFPTSPAIRKEPKFQKYLRLKNDHILEKCFDIKIENRDVPCSKEPLRQTDEMNGEMWSHQSDMTSSGASSEAEILEQAADRQQPTMQVNESGTVSQAEKTQTQRLATSRAVEASNKKLVSCAKIFSNSKQKFNSNTFKSSPSKCVRTTSSPVWQSTFRTFVTSGLRARSQSSAFAYDLSRDELKFAGHFSSAMKPPPPAERQLLKDGQRRDYLMQRYEHSPVVKYNYPEATSWRIGWLQQRQ